MQHTVSHLRSPRQEVRLSAIKDLGRAAFDQQVLKHLTELLRDPDPTKRIGTVQALGHVGAEARPQAVLLLLDALSGSDAAVRREAATALGKIGAESRPAVPVLAKALKDADAKVRMAAATALGQIGPSAAEAIPALVAALNDCNLIFCRLVAQALSQIGPAAVPALTEALHHADKNVRREAAWALGQIGPDAAAVSALTDLLYGSGGAPAGAPAPPRPAGGDATVLINFRTPRNDETQLVATNGGPGLPDNDVKVRQTVSQALERIQGKK